MCFRNTLLQSYREKFEAVITAAELVASPSCALSDEAKRTLVQSKVDALPAVKKDDATGLRIDFSLENEDTGEVWWGDVTAVHPGAETYQDKELKHLCARQIAAHVSDVFLGPDPIKLDPSPLLVERTNAKISKYSRLVTTVNWHLWRRTCWSGLYNNFVLNASWLERAPMASLLWTLYEISAASSSQTCSLLWLQVVGK